MNLAVIVVSYNTKDLLRQCLNSIYASYETRTTAQDHLTIVVVDSASHDGSAQMVEAEFPQVRLLARRDNIGFVKGNNLALQTLGFSIAPIDKPLANNHKSRITDHNLQIVDHDLLPILPDIVLLLNPDAELIEDALWQMALFLDAHPEAGVCGAKLRYGDGQFQHGAFRYPSLMQVLIDLFPLYGVRGIQRLHNSSLNGRYSQHQWNGVDAFPVDFVLGAALMLKRDVIEQVGGLDTEYVMYCEELDWCLRINQAGWQVYALPTAGVMHYEGQSSKQVRWPSFVRLWRSRFLFYEKHSYLFPKGYRFIVKQIVRLTVGWRKTQAERRFARGQATGLEIQEELAAYAQVRAIT
ncbi:MAG: glycosyltransferase family 2 protein [Chloroflexota bacterium]